ncbi:hypothetical protein [Lacipirellula sp.]|uniref:hypothetical protein n=1 Tax=Lacipirellula sp. TaxID=2691419 RepID=UPI003D0C2A97
MDRFRVKIRRNEVTYLWGGAEIKADSQRILAVPVLLTIRVDDVGEVVEFGYKQAQPAQEDSFGKLQPGESYTVSLDKLTAIWAKSTHDSYVDCQLMVPAVKLS